MPTLPSVNMYCHLAILLVTISLVYGATRHDRWANILNAAFRWGANMLFFLASVFAVMIAVSWFTAN